MYKFLTLGVALFLGFFTVSGWADSASDLKRLISPAAPIATSVVESEVTPSQQSDDIIRLTPDKTKILTLDEDASSIVVTNPLHVSVLMDSPRTLVIMPRQPGSTTFSVLNRAGKTIAEKTVIVSTTSEKKYVRIRKMCNSTSGSNCAASSYYYCPDGCYEVQPVEGTQQMPEVPDVTGATNNTLNIDPTHLEPNQAIDPSAKDNSQAIVPVQETIPHEEPRR